MSKPARELSQADKAALDGPEPSRAVAAALNMSAANVRKLRQKRGWAVAAVQAAATSGASTEALLRDEVARLKAAARAAGKQTVMEHRILESIKQALEHTPPASALYVPPGKPRAQRKTGHELLLLASDWHAGEVVDPAQVDHINEFGWSVLQRRVEALRDGVLSFVALTPSLSRLTIGWLGDMVNGTIHEELVATNEFPVAEQSVMVGELMAKLVRDLAPHVPEIACAGVAGNHSRTKPGRASTNVFDSWDWVAYHLARARTEHLPNVSWELPKAGSHIVDVASHRVLLFHGDGIRSSMVGFPAGGVARRANAKQAQYARRRQYIDMLCCGHFHDPNIMGVGRVLVNGSLVGINPFGDKNYGDGADPCQLLATFDADKPRFVGVNFVQT